MVSISLYQKSDQGNFQEYIRRAFHEKYILGDPKYLEWQYGGGLYIAKDGDEIVGHFGFRDLKCKIGERSDVLRVLMNLFVLEQYRILGVGARLAQEVFRDKYFVMVAGYSPLSQRLFPHFRPDWKDAGNLSKYLKIFRGDSPLFDGFKVPEIATIQPVSDGYELNEISSFDAKFEALWKRIRPRYQVTVERSPEYLNWRFADHPIFHYRTISASRSGTLAGYLVWRLEDGADFKVARIIDWICEPEAEKALLGKFVESAAAAGATLADFLFSGSLYRATLKELGFFDVARTEFEKFPIHFNPVSAKKPYINVAFDLPASLQDCYFTKADGDQDRPNPF
ncbi:MAG: hypothetical protein Q8L24_01470 [bacterium]|nr:hypothetical protein [bacterium]